MRFSRSLIVAAASLATHVTLAQQALVCTGSAPASCEAFHYHVQMFRPETRQFVEIAALRPYASESACNRAREAEQKRTAAVAEYFRVTKGDQRFEADRVGPCHCDLTNDKASPSYLGEQQRMMQLRLAEEVRLRVKEKLLDADVTTDNPLVRGLYAHETATPLLGGPKLAPLPPASRALVLTTPEDLKATRTIDTSKPQVAALDLPIVDLTTPEAPPAAPAAEVVTATPETPAPAPAPAPAPEQPMTEQPVHAEAEPVTHTEAEPEQVVEARTEDETLSAQEAAAGFISYETQRINNVLKASSAIADEDVKSRIFEACMQRLNLLSNLRLLIEGSGVRSRLAAAAREAQTEAERLGVVARLFGDDIRPHWAPSDASDVIFDVGADIASEPERTLRDNSGKFSARDKKHALYALLAHAQPTEEQRLWLTSVIDGFLQ
jgi:hypothetical protein